MRMMPGRMLSLVAVAMVVHLEMDTVLAECNFTVVDTDINICFETINTEPDNPTICGNPDDVISCLDNSIVTCSDFQVGLWRAAISRYHANLIQLCAQGSSQNPYCDDTELTSGFVDCILLMKNYTCSEYRAEGECYFSVISNCSLFSPVHESHPYMIVMDYFAESECEFTAPCGYNALLSCRMIAPLESSCMTATQTTVCEQAFLDQCPDTTYITQDAIYSSPGFIWACSAGCNVTQLLDDVVKCGNPFDMSSMTCDDLILRLGCYEGAVALAICSVETMYNYDVMRQARANIAANCTDGTTESNTSNTAEAPKLYIRLTGLMLIISMALL